MLYHISTSTSIYETEEKEHVEKLSRLGFKFSIEEDNKFYRENRTIDVEINSLEQLQEFISEYGDIVLSYGNRIEIYDDYRE